MSACYGIKAKGPQQVGAPLNNNKRYNYPILAIKSATRAL